MLASFLIRIWGCSLEGPAQLGTGNGSLGIPGTKIAKITKFKEIAKNPKFGGCYFSFKFKHFFLTQLLL